MRRRYLSILLITLILLTSIPSFAFASTVLKTGSRGSEVAQMQQRLIQLGYLSGKADGIFGSATAGAVKSFQKANGLSVDGIAGPATLGILYSANAKPAGSSTPSGGGSTGTTAPPTGTAPIQRVLRRGDRGSDVAALQNRLNELKYNCGTPDGIFGGATENAVRAFQRDKGLTADGIVGSKTIAALFSGTSTPPTTNPGTSNPGTTNPGTQNPSTGGGSTANPITTVLKRGSTGSQVKALQIKLNELGYNCGTPDGIFGTGTYNAVVSFQRANNLTADGIVGPATAAKLFSIQSGSGSSPDQPPTQTTDPTPHPDPTPGSLNGKIVIIDPGHGGVDSGAYHNGIKEADMALDMGLRLRRMLEQAGATVYMTRSDNRYVSLFYRSAFANKIVLDLEIQSVNAQMEQAGKDISEKQAGIAALANDKISLSAYMDALMQLKDIVDSQNAVSAQWVMGNLSTEMQLIIASGIQMVKEGLSILGLDYENKSLGELSAALNEYTGEEQDLKAQLLADVAEISEIAGTALTIAAIGNELSEREYAAESLSAETAQAEELRNALSQQWKDWIHLGNQMITAESLSELDQMIASAAQAVSQTDVEAGNLQQEINTLNSAVTGYNNALAELQRLLNGFQYYFDNPSYNSRTAIYNVIKNGTQSIASDDLKKVMDLTLKYQDRIVFVAIHLNDTTAPQTSASGFITFYRDNQPVSSSNADYYEGYNSAARFDFASKLLQEVNKTTNFSKKYSAAMNNDLSVLRENNVVSSLVEVGFMNNPGDLSLVAQPSFRENVAYGLYRGIEEYFK